MAVSTENPSLAGEKSKVLFIDDDPSVLASLHLLFDSIYETYSASTVAEGLRIFEVNHPKVVVLDIRLPDRSGIEALREIRRMDASAAVIMLTGNSTINSAEESVRLGAVDYVNKPFDSSSLKNRIAQLALASVARQSDKNIEYVAKESLDNFSNLQVLQDASSAFLHDVTSPLTCLKISAEFLEKKMQEKEDVETAEISQIVGMMSQSVSFLQALVEHWRSFSDLHTLMHAKCRADHAIETAIQQVIHQIPSPEVLLQVQAPKGNYYIPGDQFAVARSLINLLLNAFAAVSPLSGRILLTASQQENSFQIIIADNGPGIDSSVIDRIFLPNYTTKPGGKGIGLHVSKKIIESIGGKITVKSPGTLSGADFIVTLPLAN